MCDGSQNHGFGPHFDEQQSSKTQAFALATCLRFQSRLLT